MRILVTGATGFLGGRLSRMLVEAGHEVVGLGRDADKGRALANDGIRFVRGDLSAPPESTLVKALGGADAFVHAGGLSSAWGRRKDFIDANVKGTRHALAMARSADAERFVFISSPSVSFRFADQVDVREDNPLPTPVNFYAESKQVAERDVLAARGLLPIVLRPRAIYGPGDKALLPRLVRAAGRGALPLLRGGQASTNLTYVDDAAAAIIAALEAPASLSGRIYNIAGEVQPIRSIVEKASAMAGTKVRWRKMPWPVAFAATRVAENVARVLPGNPEPVVTAYGLGILAFTQTLDTSAARRDLGFDAGISFADGLARTFGETS